MNISEFLPKSNVDAKVIIVLFDVVIISICHVSDVQIYQEHLRCLGPFHDMIFTYFIRVYYFSQVIVFLMHANLKRGLR